MRPTDSVDVHDALAAMFGQSDDPTSHRIIGTGGLGLDEDVLMLVAHGQQWECSADRLPPCHGCGLDLDGFW
jgi:hypothetical protein